MDEKDREINILRRRIAELEREVQKKETAYREGIFRGKLGAWETIRQICLEKSEEDQNNLARIMEPEK